MAAKPCVGHCPMPPRAAPAMHLPPPRKLLFAALALLAIQTAPAEAQVTDWFIYKEKVFDQTANNTPASSANEFNAGVLIRVQNASDATMATISGGGIGGPLPLDYEPGDGIWEGEVNFATEGALDATVPNSTVYTLTLSGGTLGTLVQTVTMPAKGYPNTPYLTGTKWTEVQAYVPSAMSTITWNDPGPLTLASGLTILDIQDSNGITPHAEQTMGVSLSTVIPADTLNPTLSYEGYLIFTNTLYSATGGGFGVAGASHQGVSLAFYLETTPTTYCAGGTSGNGCVASLSAVGLPSASAPSGFVVTATSIEGNKDGLFFVGTNGRQSNAWGNGTSFQCVVPPVKRFGLLPTNGTNGLCNGTKSQDFNAYWDAFPAKNPGAGTVVQAQLWYRDLFNTSNQKTSLSNAIEFTLNP